MRPGLAGGDRGAAGASGAVPAKRMIHYMRNNGLSHGPQTMREGGGTASATLLELV